MADRYSPIPKVDTTLGWSAHGDAAQRNFSMNGGGYRPPWLGTAARALPGSGQYAQTAAGVEPLPRDAVDNLGKTMISLAPGNSTNVLDTEEEAPLKTPGFAEGFLGGITEAFTGALPGFIRDPLVGVAKGLGSGIDLPLEAIGHLPINEWVGLENAQGAFDLLPVTQEKAVTIAQMKADPVNANWYLSRYVRTHGGDYAAAKGLPQLLAPIIQPDATVLERGLMALGLPSQMIARTYAGMANRADELINSVDPNLHPEVKALQERYARGELGQVGSEEARNRLLDEMTVQGFGYTNDPFVGMLAEMLLDPIIIGGMGSGLALKAVRTGALARRMAGVSRIARAEVLGGKASPQLMSAVDRVEDLMKAGQIKTTGRFDDTYQFGRELMKDTSPDVRRIVDQATNELSTKDRAMVRMTPAIEAAAGVSRALNEPFRFFGKDGAAGLVARKFSRDTTQGTINAFDMGKVANIYRGMTESAQATLNDSLGYAISFSERSLLQSSLVKQMRTSIKDDNGNMVRPDWMPDAVNRETGRTMTPDDVLDALQTVENPAGAAQAENFMRRVKEQFVPELGDMKGEAREKAHARAMEGYKDNAAKQLAYASDGKLTVAEARAMLKNATDDELAFAHFVQWGRFIKDFEAAQKIDATGNQNLVSTQIDSVRQYEQAGGQGQGPRKVTNEVLHMQEIISRATPIGARELTREQAKAILKKIENMAPNDAVVYLEDFVAQKEILHQHFWSKTRIITDEAYVADLTTFLKAAVDNGSLVQEVKRANLPPALAALLDEADARGAPYEIGLAPETSKRFSPVHNAKGELKGYSAWMDVRVAAADVKTPTRFDVLRERLWTPIRAENMLQESRRKFIRQGVRSYNLDRYSASAVFDAIREASSVERTTMRAFSPHEFARILDQTDISPEMKQRLGKRGLAELTARAMEGDLKMVGVTTKATGMLKTQTAHYGNFMGRLAERVYPLIRFDLNPFFLMQEWVEPYFFNILRGVKPGVKFGTDQVEFHTLLDEWNMASVLADGFEAREFSMTGGYHARENMGPQTKLGMLVSKMPFGRVQEVKKANYVNLTKKQFGENLHSAFQKTYPGRWEPIEAFFNEMASDAAGKPVYLSREDVAIRWYANKGMYNPDSKTRGVLASDMAVPDDLGRIDGIRKSHLAQEFGFDDIPSFRAAMIDKTNPRHMDEWDFRSQLVAAGASNEYAVRAYNVAIGLDVTDILDRVEQGYIDADTGLAARNMMDLWLRTMSEIKGITKEEYAARKFAQMPKWLDAQGTLPQSAFFQLTDRLIQESGFPKMAVDDARYVATRQLATQMMPEFKHKTRQGHVNAARKTSVGTVNPGTGFAAERRKVGNVELNPDADVSDFKRLNDEAGMSPEDINGVGEWYRQVGPMFAAVAHGMDDATLRAAAAEMNAKMKGVKAIDLKDTEGIANEVGARMLMAWGATQVQTSPRNGFSYVLKTIDFMTRGQRANSKGIGLFDRQKAQLTAMLTDFDRTVNVDGLGAKLHDFIDSLLGNEQRTFMRQVDADGVELPQQMFTRRDGTVHPMQPGAMDMWMGRDAGFVDSPYIGIMADGLRRADPNLSKADALVQAQLESGFFAKKSVKVKVWDEDEQKFVTKSRGEKADAYNKRKAAFEEEHGLAPGTMQTVWSGSPSPAQYEFMLERYNRITDDLNAEGYLGRGYAEGNAWTVADVQAIAWMRIQKANNIDPGGPTNMFHQNATQVSFEIVPGQNTPLRDAIPMNRATDDAKDIITTDVSLVLADLVQERTGVQITRSVPGRGGWRGGPDEYTLSPNTFWEMLGSDDAIEDALDYISYMTQQDMVMATAPPNRKGGKLPMKSSEKNHWAIHFAPEIDDALTLDALGEFIESKGMPWNGHMVGSTPGDRSVIRSVYRPAWGDDASNYKGTFIDKGTPEGYIDIPDGADEAGFAAMTEMPADLVAALESGQWAIEAGINDAPIPVTTVRELVHAKHRYNDFTADRVRADARLADGVDPKVVYKEEIGRPLVDSLTERGRGNVATEMVNRDLEALTQVWDQSLKSNDGNAWAVGRGSKELLSYDTRGEGPYLQSSPRGWLGATSWQRKRDATQRVARGQLGGRRGRVYLKSDDGTGAAAANVTTPTHELFHLFADDLDPSGVAAVHNAYYVGTKKKRAPKNNNRLTVEAEEWLAAQFEEFASTGLVPEGNNQVQLHAIFQAYDRTVAGMADPVGTVTDQGGKALESITNVQAGPRRGLRPELQNGPAMTFDVDQFRMMETARIALQRAEEEAFRAHYYKRGRTLLERSINHPYLGMYPASYMWGKVLPELMRFLVKKPFGVDAPFAGMAMANHVWNAIQLEMATDNSGTIQELVEDFPEALRFMQLMVPGTPWDIPVNMPAWTRRIAQDAWQGKEADIPGAISDTVSYAFGPGRAPSDMVEFLQDFQNMGTRAGQMLSGTYQSEEEKEEEAKRLKFQGLTPPEEPEAPTRLIPGTGFDVGPQVP